MSSSFKELVEPKDVDYALRRRTDRIYISSSFEAKVGSDKGSPSRFIRKVFDEVEEEDGRDNLESEDYEVSTTPGGRKQIQLQVVREAGVIRQIEIQKVSRGSKGNDKPELKSILSLNREQSTKLIQLIKALDSIPPDGDRIERIDDYLVREMLSLPDTLRQAYAEDPERFKELIRTDASASDVIALQHRRKVVETMQTWLTDAAAFEEASNASKGPERAWQQLLEKNRGSWA